eukprot:4241038-Pyramimonas_sp.AAC.1
MYFGKVLNGKHDLSGVVVEPLEEKARRLRIVGQHFKVTVPILVRNRPVDRERLLVPFRTRVRVSLPASLQASFTPTCSTPRANCVKGHHSRPFEVAARS